MSRYGIFVVTGILACWWSPLGCGEATPEPAEDVVITEDVDAEDTAPEEIYVPPQPVCTPGASECTSDTEFHICSVTGLMWLDTQLCPESSICQGAGVCQSSFCVPNAAACLDYFTIQICDETGGFWSDIVPCNGGTHCEEGQCVSCSPGDMECADWMTAQVCNQAGTWETTECNLGMHCIEGECLVCDPGEIYCVAPESFNLCSEDGLYWKEGNQCPDGEWCVFNSCTPCDLNIACQSDELLYTQCVQGEEVIWDETTLCGPEELCLDGACFFKGCIPTVIFVVDRSGSMGIHWNAVKNSVVALVETHPDMRFGLLGFPIGSDCAVPSDLQVDLVIGNPSKFETWFNIAGPAGATPLLGAMNEMKELAPELMGDYGGSLVVISDGEDTCASGDVVTGLGTAAGFLFGTHDIHTYVIGYAFGGNTSQLDSLALYGGTSFSHYIPAGSESELSQALYTVIDDMKLCLGD
jgi:hypothetical protein